MLSEQDFFSPLKGRHFSGEKAACLQVFYSKEKKPSVTQSYCVEEAGKATFYSFQKEAKLPFLFVNRPHSGTYKFRIPENVCDPTSNEELLEIYFFSKTSKNVQKCPMLNMCLVDDAKNYPSKKCGLGEASFTEGNPPPPTHHPQRSMPTF